MKCPSVPAIALGIGSGCCSVPRRFRRRFSRRRLRGVAPGQRRASGQTAACTNALPLLMLIAVRAGRLFDSKTGQMLTRRVVAPLG